MRSLLKPLILVLVLIPCIQAEVTPTPDVTLPEIHNDTFIQGLIRRTIIGVGISVRSDELKITNETLGGEGTLVRERGVEPFLTIGFENAYFGESRWGYSAVFGYTQFEMDEQKVGDQNIDLGTSADGELFFIAPSIFYMFGAKHYDGWYFKPGLALGVGYLKTKGDVLLTDLGGNPRHSFNIKSDPISVSYGIYMETGYNDWFFRFQVAGPVVEEDDRDIQGTTLGITIGYYFHPFRNINF